MKTLPLAPWLASPVLTFLAVGCTIVTTPQPMSRTAPPPAQPAPAPAPPPATAAPTPTTTPAPTAEKTPAPASTGAARKRPPMGIPRTNAPPRSERSPASRHFAFRIPVVASDTVFGGSEKKEGALEGLLYLLPRTMTSLPDLSAEKPVLKLYTDHLDIASQDFKSGFPDVTRRFEYFVIHYEGSFLVKLPGAYSFRLVSDDGSRLRIDNVPLINNDGVHEATEKSGDINLASGNHRIDLDYFQAQKNVALQLFVTGPDGQERPWSPTL